VVEHCPAQAAQRDPGPEKVPDQVRRVKRGGPEGPADQGEGESDPSNGERARLKLVEPRLPFVIDRLVDASIHGRAPGS
jgi:hypothetical protein